MIRALLAILLCTASSACTIQSGAPSGPTFTRAQQVAVLPAVPKKATAKPAATRSTGAYINPSADSMQNATWVIEGFDQNQIYRLPLSPGRITTILLHEGDKLNAITGGNLDGGFTVTNSYVGSRPAVAIMPNWGGVTSDLHLATTNRIYSLYAYTGRNQINLVDFKDGAEGASATGVASDLPTPQGDYGELTFAAPDGKPLPAWAPVKVWADSDKLVIRFAGPLPQLPVLLAGGQGEQMVTYYTVDDHGDPTIVTDRRVTIAQLRLGDEVIEIPAKEAAPAHDWRQAASLPAPAPNVAVFVLPNAPDSQTFQASTPSGGI